MSSARHINAQDKAAIPALIHYPSQKRCQDWIIQDAREWRPDMADANEAAVRKAIVHACKTYSESRRSARQRARLKATRALRDTALAHWLYDKEEGRAVLFRDVDETLRVVVGVIAAASFAIDGRSFRSEQWQAELRRQAETFWAPVINAGRKPA